ncbi:PadR family transcriptional regulator [uncultured Amnibacterium sp.]|uniref:PadR family transcriptional regulator n=1 Tax=uncultured Amnibacterium sp. TaxID=1631851 RepID=UPI0035CB9D30
MTRPSTSIPAGSRTREGVARGLSGIREVLDELRNPSDRRSATRGERPDSRDEVLEALAEGPADGYRIARLLAERGQGEPTPGAGVVYPTLQLLADEGLATAEDTDGRKVWTLTPAGHAAAAAARTRSAPEQEAPAAHGPAHRASIVRSGAQLAQVVAIAAQSVERDRVGEVVAAIDEARRRILAVLARS